MTELADRALISRSGMTRRVARLVDDGLVRRANATADARGVVVALTQAGVERLAETAPVHARGIRKLFVDKLNDHELAAIEKSPGEGHPRLRLRLGLAHSQELAHAATRRSISRAGQGMSSHDGLVISSGSTR